MCILTAVLPVITQLDQPEPEADVAIVIGQDTLGAAQGITYSATAQVSESRLLCTVQIVRVALLPSLFQVFTT